MLCAHVLCTPWLYCVPLGCVVRRSPHGSRSSPQTSGGRRHRQKAFVVDIRPQEEYPQIYYVNPPPPPPPTKQTTTTTNSENCVRYIMLILPPPPPPQQSKQQQQQQPTQRIVLESVIECETILQDTLPLGYEYSDER